MDTYQFNINNYHSIANASIRLAGLTVLAGLNGCGKSTISRWLYGYVRFSNSFEKLVDNLTIGRLTGKLRQLIDILRRLQVWSGIQEMKIRNWHSVSVEECIGKINECTKQLCELIESNWDRKGLKTNEEWIWKALEVNDSDIVSVRDRVDLFAAIVHQFILDAIEKADSMKFESSTNELVHFIETDLNLEGKGPSDMEFMENGTHLIKDGRFMHPISLKRAVYIDSPMAFSNEVLFGYDTWEDLSRLMNNPLKNMSTDASSIALDLRYTLGGSIFEKEDSYSKELRYLRKADGLNISIDELATGMKSFAYLLRLLENGYLDSETLLIIDEPEAHLHPQWIFRFAKALVMIHKQLGVKIMIASHNPDMVAAISAISEAEGLADRTDFYQAEKLSETLRYEFKHCGNDISPIFECFNIAIDRIDSYKSSVEEQL